MPGRSLKALFWAVSTGAVLCALLPMPLHLPGGGATPAAAQFAPPSTILGSVADSAGEIPAGVKVEAYIGDLLCSQNRDGSQKGVTQFAGDGAAKVTIFVVDALSKEDRDGCGFDGAVVRIKVGDRFATQTGIWHAGLVMLNVTFGTATPAVIPTLTPAPATPTATARPTRAPAEFTAIAATAVSQQTSIANGTPASSFSPIATVSRGTPAGTSDGRTPGGLQESTPGTQAATKDGGGGFPAWGFAIIALAVLAVLGGIIGVTMARRKRDVDEIEEPHSFERPDDDPPA